VQIGFEKYIAQLQQEIRLSQRNRATPYVSWNLVNC